MNSLARVIELLTRFEVAHGCQPNIIVLGFDAHDAFIADLGRLLGPLNSDPDIRGTGNFFRGCRVLRTDSPGVWVGRVVEPIK